MYSPNPIPSDEVVANLVNSLGKTLASIPVPVSFILTTTTFSPSSSASTFFVLISAVTVIVPPSFTNLIAFLSRFDMIWYILVLSASTKISFSLPSTFESNFIFIFLLLLLASFLI